MPFNKTNVIERSNNVRHRDRGNYFVRGRGRGRYHEERSTHSFEQDNFCGCGRGHGHGRGCDHIYERNQFGPRYDDFILNKSRNTKAHAIDVA